MTDSRFIRDDFEHCLAHFIEECGEALAAAGKTARWGWDSYNPDLPEAQRETNANWLLREMMDLRETMDRLQRCMVEERLPDRLKNIIAVAESFAPEGVDFWSEANGSEQLAEHLHKSVKRI